MRNVLDVTKGGRTTGKSKDEKAKENTHQESTGVLSTLDSYLPRRPVHITLDDLDEDNRDEVEEIYWNGIEANHSKHTIRKHIRIYLNEQGYLLDTSASRVNIPEDGADDEPSEEGLVGDIAPKGLKKGPQTKKMKDGKPSMRTKKDKSSIDKQVEKPSKRQKKDEPSIGKQVEKPSKRQKQDEPSIDKKVEKPSKRQKQDEPSIDKKVEKPSKRPKQDEPSIEKHGEKPAKRTKKDRSSKKEKDIQPGQGSGDAEDDKGTKKWWKKKGSKHSEEVESTIDHSKDEVEKDRDSIVDIYRRRMKSRYVKRSINTYSQRYLDPSVDLSSKNEIKREAMLYGFRFFREMEKRAKEDQEREREALEKEKAAQEEQAITSEKGEDEFDEKRGQMFLNVMYVIIGAVFLLGFILIPLAEKSSYTFVVTSGSMEPDLQLGDIIFVSKTDPEDIEVGDIITYNQEGASTTVTHRCIAIMNSTEATDSATDDDEIYFQTKGDANEDNDTKLVPGRNLVGKVSTYDFLNKNYYVKLPRLGYVNHYAHTTLGFLLLIIIPGFSIIGMEIYDLFRDDYFTKDGYTLFKSKDGKYFFERRSKGKPTYMPKGYSVGKDKETGKPILIGNRRKKGFFKR